MSATAASEPVLEIEGLRVAFRARRSAVTALRDVGVALGAGRTLALVGESGSGKSVTSLSVMGLLPRNGAVEAGRILYRRRDGTRVDLARLDETRFRAIRGREIAMIFQEPMSSLNPLFTVGDQIGEMLLLHTDLDARARRRRVIEMLELVEIPAAASRMNAYPHELSGGMRQRVMIALALVCEPALLIADEPTTALDVTIQAQILDLMRRLQRELRMAILFITHDMGVVAEMADDVAVMYAGAVVEAAPVATLFARPSHPYTRGLLATIPRPGRPRGERLVPIPGSVPALSAMPPGCAFAPRCPIAVEACREPVALAPLEGDHRVACHLAHAHETVAAHG
ncbi:ABC transporter ATP-binding protein [Salinarimonas rosea]|uniref:ABC transporter ATP-binding protein n=1 Tax=Salinarimonas rosea TaxID=552063 RepID=UPI0003F7EB0B|nr:ABC transporter ATP-binding protein [Salinarimonas rosea]